MAFPVVEPWSCLTSLSVAPNQMKMLNGWRAYLHMVYVDGWLGGGGRAVLHTGLEEPGPLIDTTAQPMPV